MSRSMLIRRDIPPEGGETSPTLVGLHGRGGSVDQLIPLCRALALPARIVAPQAIRPVAAGNPLLAGSHGYRWYFGDRGSPPEPATLGESLWQVEQLLLELALEGSRPIFLIGYDQGAAVATTLALAAPDLLAGVVAIAGPDFAGLASSNAPGRLDGLPVLLVADASWPDDVDEMRACASRFGEAGGAVHCEEARGVRGEPALAADPIRHWIRQRLESAKKHSAS